MMHTRFRRDGAPARARLAPALAAFALAGVLGACTMFEPPAPPPPCPRVARVDDASQLTRFAGAGRDLTDVAFEAQISDMRGSCAYEENAIDVELSVEIIASRGPADQDRRADFSYFVAIVRTDQTVLAREEFDTYIEFPGNQVRAGIVEELVQEIPLAEGQAGPDFVIYVGFVLSEDELAFNRAQR